MKTKGIFLALALIMLLLLSAPVTQNASAEDGQPDLPAPISGISGSKHGKVGDFDYEYWSQNADPATMWFTGGGTFHCEWEAHNILFRTGKKLGSTKTYSEYGDIVIEYEGFYNLSKGSVSYLTVYGWTKNPLMEWYIVEDRGSYRPGKTLEGTIEVDGAEYDVYTDLRVDQPSIEGTKTFPQIYSIRKEGRSSGTITVSDHFKEWEKLGLEVSGNLYEVSMCIEGYGSSGNGAITKYVMSIGDDVYGSEDDYLGPPTPPEPDPTEAPVEPDLDIEAEPEPVQVTEEPSEPKEEPTTPEPANGSSGPGLIVWVLVGVVVGAAGGCGFYFIKKAWLKSKEKSK